MFWLASFTVRVAETEIDTHHMIAAADEILAEAAAQSMGGTWWEKLEEERDGHWWGFPEGDITFFSLVPLMDVEAQILRDLKFLDRWCATTDGELTVVRDEFGELWSDFRR